MNKSGKNETRIQDQGQENMAGFDNTGAYLRKLRTERGLSIKDTCEATRISEINLKAIENQDFEALPAETFIRGLLNIYARFLGAEPGYIVTRFMREREQYQAGGKRVRTRPAGHQILAPKKLAEPAHISSITMAVVLLVVIVVLFTGFCLYTSWNPFSFLGRGTDSFHPSVIHALPSDMAPPPSAPVAENREAASALPLESPPAPDVDTPVEPVPAPGAKSVTPPAAESVSPPPAESVSPPPAESVSPPAAENVAPAASTSQEPPVQKSSESITASPQTSAGTDKVTVEFLKDSRLILTRNNEEQVNSLFKKGEKRSWPLTGRLQLTFDQPECAVIKSNGRQLPFPDEEGGVYSLSLPAEPPGTSTP